MTTCKRTLGSVCLLCLLTCLAAHAAGSKASGTANGSVYTGQMIHIPAGSFLMGNNGHEPGPHPKSASTSGKLDEFPQHRVYLSDYWIGKYEVTRGEYRKFVNAGGYSKRAYWSSAGWEWRVRLNRTEPEDWAAHEDWGPDWNPCPFTQTDNHPVVGVTYHEAEAFCNWAGGHLPTEAQWEKAARWDGHPRAFPWGDTWDPEKCNSLDDHNPAGGGYRKWQTAPVGSYPSGASVYGCHDMAGNVLEWCKDWYDLNYYSQTPSGGWSDPQGPPVGSRRVQRGGSWFSYYVYSYFRCACRYAAGPGWSLESSYGFRLAR